MMYNNAKIEISPNKMEFNRPYTRTKEDVFNELVKAHIDELYNFASHMLLDSDEAEDAVQKTFISLYKNQTSLDLNTSIRPWLFKVLRNTCLDSLKKKKTLSLYQENEDGENIIDVPAEDLVIESKLDDQIFLQKVREKLAELPVPLREIILLKYFEDLSFPEIAASLDIPENTVKSHFYRGKTKLYNLIVGA